MDAIVVLCAAKVIGRISRHSPIETPISARQSRAVSGRLMEMSAKVSKRARRRLFRDVVEPVEKPDVVTGYAPHVGPPRWRSLDGFRSRRGCAEKSSSTAGLVEPRRLSGRDAVFELL